MCARLLGVMGDFGTGKSTSVEHLDHTKTLYINYLGTKDLMFKGSRKKYVPNIQTGGNLVVSPPASAIPYILTQAPELSRFKIGILDDISYTMTNEFMDTAKQKGYDKFTSMAVNFKSIIDACEKSPLEWIVIMLHSDPVYNNSEIIGYKVKTVGKLIDTNVRIEGLFSILLMTDVTTTDDPEHPAKYEFVTNREGYITAKSPRGMLPQRMDNDLAQVIELAEKYYNSED